MTWASYNERRCWPGEHVSVMCELWSSGRTASQIAGEIYTRFGAAVTRNAVLGKLCRLGLLGRGDVRTHDEKSPRRSRPQNATGILARARRHDPGLAQEPTADTSDCAVPFIDRQKDQCAFPLWTDATPPHERMCCGAPRAYPDVATRPYCARHEKIVYARLP